MRLTTFSGAFLVTLMACECRARIKVAEPDPYSHLDDVAVEILTKCYEDRKAAIGISGDTSDYLLKTLLSRQLIDVTLVHNTERKVDNPVSGRANRHQHRLSVFVIISYPKESELYTYHTADIIRSTIRSNWWNHLASFIIILKLERGCYQSPHQLRTVWAFHIINANFICNNFKTSPSPLIQTFNPYINWAPKPWKPIYKFPMDYWRKTWFFLFIRRYQNNEEMCNQLDFDKTQDLGGSTIETSIPIVPLEAINRPTNQSSLHVLYGEMSVMHSIRQALNATYKMMGRNSTIHRGNLRMGVFKGVGVIPMAISIIGQAISYPYKFSEHTLMSHFRGHKTQLEKILGVIDRTSQLAVCLTLLLTVAFWKFFVGQSLTPAFMNVLRVVCNTGFSDIPEYLSSRVFLACILIFTVVMQGIFQGDLATLLTTAVPNPNINTLQDLLKYGSNIYSPFGKNIYFPELEGFTGKKLMIGMFEPCGKYLQNDTSGVCYNFAGLLLDEAFEHGMHLSDRAFSFSYLGKWYEKDFPLETRINNILQRMVETGILDPIIVRASRRSMNDDQFQYDSKVLANKKVNVMTLQNLAFAFVLLGIGLTCATIIFICEIVISWNRSRIRTEKVQFLN